MSTDCPSIGRVTIRKLMRHLEGVEDLLRTMNYRDAEDFVRLRSLAVGGIYAAREQLATYVRHYTYGEITAGTLFKLHPTDARTYVKHKEALRVTEDNGTATVEFPVNKLAPNQIVYVRVERGDSISWE